MANNTDNGARRHPAARRRRRRSGVPTSLVIVLIIMALLMGALGGYVVARKTDPHIHELQENRDRMTELENTLTLIGYPVDDDVDPEQWLYDRTADDSALADLSGEGWNEDEGDSVWNDASLLTGTLSEDGEPVVVAEFDGGQLLSTEVIPVYNDQLTTQIFAGHNADDVAEETLNRVLEQLAGDKIIAARAQELGLTEMSEEDLAQIEAQAAQTYETQLADYIAFVGGADRETAAQQLSEESGVTLEGIVEQLKQNWWSQKYYDYTVKDVAVTDEEVQACYDALLAKQKEDFSGTTENFEYAHRTGQPIVWRPEGYRAVRDILIRFTDDADIEQAARLLDQLELEEDEQKRADAQAQLDKLFAPLEKKAAEAQAKLEGGAAFADLMDEYGCDEALKDEPLRSQGYYITDTSFVNSAEYVTGSMMLEQPGQVSSPLRSEYGVHLVEYIGDLAPGEVPLADVQEAVSAEALKQKQAEYYAQQRQALLEAANVKYYPERLH